MFEPTSFTEIQLQVPAATIKVLEEGNPKDKYLEAEFSIAETDGTPGTAGAFSAPIKIGIKLKGSLGSARKFSEKAAFKIKFDKFVEGQTLDGLEKLTLNNMVQDPSMIHEVTTYQAFRDMAVPAPHAGYSYLTVNGKSYGLHLNIETQDSQSLENAFGTPFVSPPQHLYSGEYDADVSEELRIEAEKAGEKKWEALEVSEGDEEEEKDLERLVKRVAEPSPSFAQRMVGYADLNEMTKDWLVEKYTGDWDSYSGLNPSRFEPNNYYLYSDGSGEFQMTPWGTDQTWQHNYENLSFTQGGGILFSECINDTTAGGCLGTYRAAGKEALVKLNALELGTVARCTAAAVRPWREYEIAHSEAEKQPNSEKGKPPYGLSESLAQVAATETFVANRPASLAAYLGVSAPPKESGEPACPPLRPIGGFPPPNPPPPTPSPTPSSTTPPASPQPPAATTLQLGHFSAGVKRIVVRLTVSGPGTVATFGTYRVGGKRRRACAGRTAVVAAGAAAVTCRLTAGFRGRLAKRPLQVDLTANFTPAAGAATSASRTLRLRRG